MRVVNQTLDQSFELVIASAAEIDRPMLRELPRRIGVSSRPSGGWDDYSKLEPMRSLPYFASELCPNVTEATIDRYVLAHRAAGFAGLVIDRVADRQTEKDPELTRAIRILIRCWVDRLVDATGDTREDILGSVRAVLGSYARGLRAERRFGRNRRGRANEYAEYVALKTDWLALATRSMLVFEGAEESVEQFQVCFEALLLGLQLADDALDTDEDRSLRGLAVSDHLDVASVSMLIAAERIVRETEDVARTSGLTHLAAFCSVYACQMRSAIPKDLPVAAIGAVFLLAEIAKGGPNASPATERAIMAACNSHVPEPMSKPTSPVSSWQLVS